MNEHLIDAIAEVLMDTHDMDVTDRDYAKAIVAALPGMIAPLEWSFGEPQQVCAQTIIGEVVCSQFGGTWFHKGTSYPSKAAAQTGAENETYRAAIMAAFVPPEGDG